LPRWITSAAGWGCMDTNRDVPSGALMKWCCGLDQVTLNGGRNEPTSAKIRTGNSGHSIKV